MASFFQSDASETISSKNSAGTSVCWVMRGSTATSSGPAIFLCASASGQNSGQPSHPTASAPPRHRPAFPCGRWQHTAPQRPLPPLRTVQDTRAQAGEAGAWPLRVHKGRGQAYALPAKPVKFKQDKHQHQKEKLDILHPVRPYGAHGVQRGGERGGKPARGKGTCQPRQRGPKRLWPPGSAPEKRCQKAQSQAHQRRKVLCRKAERLRERTQHSPQRPRPGSAAIICRLAHRVARRRHISCKSGARTCKHSQHAFQGGTPASHAAASAASASSSSERRAVT